MKKKIVIVLTLMSLITVLCTISAVMAVTEPRDTVSAVYDGAETIVVTGTSEKADALVSITFKDPAQNQVLRVETITANAYEYRLSVTLEALGLTSPAETLPVVVMQRLGSTPVSCEIILQPPTEEPTQPPTEEPTQPPTEEPTDAPEKSPVPTEGSSENPPSGDGSVWIVLFIGILCVGGALFILFTVKRNEKSNQ